MIARLAVLVDGDNISGAHAVRILDTARKHGSPDVVRVYSDAQRASPWHDAVEYRLIHAGTGKNASDVLLAIDAMELALSGGYQAFVIASSDGDFTHIARRLREYGKVVVGMGEVKTPQSFRSACTCFFLIGDRTASARAPAPPPASASAPTPDVTDLDRKIRVMIAARSKNGQGIRIADLSHQMHTKHDTRISSYPEKTWRVYLLARPGLYDVDPRGPESMVRFKPDGFHAASE